MAGRIPPSSQTHRGLPRPVRRWRPAAGCPAERRPRRRTPGCSGWCGSAGTSPSGCTQLGICPPSSPQSCRWRRTCPGPAGTLPGGTPGPAPRICPWCPTWAGDTPGRRRPPCPRGTGGTRRRASGTSVCAVSRGRRARTCWGWRRRRRWRWAERSPGRPNSHPAPGPARPQSRCHSEDTSCPGGVERPEVPADWGTLWGN